MYKSDKSPGKETAFVVTGDITAMWIRDSTNQVGPYVSYISSDGNASALVRGVIRQQVRGDRATQRFADPL